MVFILTSLCIITLPIRIYLEYGDTRHVYSIILMYKDLLIKWHHVLLGIVLFLNMYIIFDYIKTIKINKILVFSDKYSYSIYLVHQIFILGTYSLLFISSNLFLNISVIIFITIISGILLHSFTNLIIKINYGTILKPFIIKFKRFFNYSST